MHYPVLTHLPFLQKSDKENPIIDFALAHGRFKAAMMQQIEDMMEPYDVNTEIPAYLEFVDVSKSVLNDYHTRGLDVVRLSNGSICHTFDSWFHEKYIIKDGLIFHRNWGQLHHPKRTKKAKRIHLIENYPFNKFYPSLDKFAKDWNGYKYNKDTQAYGYYTNLDGYYDWYLVGGRWPDRWLIAADDPFYVPSENTWAAEVEKKNAPDGYRWVSGARKSSIQWELMKTWAVDNATKLFHQLEQWFATGIQAEELKDGYHLIDDHVVWWDDLVCKKDTTLEQFLMERGLAPEQRFLIDSYYIVSKGDWECQKNHPDEPIEGSAALSWRQFMERYLDGLSDDEFIVMLDIHN